MYVTYETYRDIGTNVLNTIMFDIIWTKAIFAGLSNLESYGT